MLIYQVLAYTMQEKMKKVIQEQWIKTLTPKWKDKFELSDGSCSISDTQEYVIKNKRY